MNCISGVLELLTQANGSTFPPKATRYGGASTSLVRLLTWSFPRSSMGWSMEAFRKGFWLWVPRGLREVLRLEKRRLNGVVTGLWMVASCRSGSRRQARRCCARFCLRRRGGRPNGAATSLHGAVSNEAAPNAAQCLEADWERMVTCCRFPRAHWQHLRTTNSAESPFAAARLRTGAATRLRKA